MKVLIALLAFCGAFLLIALDQAWPVTLFGLIAIPYLILTKEKNENT